MTHEIPKCPWSRVGIDLFSCLGKEYLITVDYYSDFWELDLLLANPTAASVITKCKINFSRHGIQKRWSMTMVHSLQVKNLQILQKNGNSVTSQHLLITVDLMEKLKQQSRLQRQC